MPRRRLLSSCAAWRTRSSQTRSKRYAHALDLSAQLPLSLYATDAALVVLFVWRQAYHLDPQRIERIFTIAKLRYLESTWLIHVYVCAAVFSDVSLHLFMQLYVACKYVL